MAVTLESTGYFNSRRFPVFARDVTKDNVIVNVIETKEGTMFAQHSRNTSRGVGKCLQCSSVL